MKRFLLPIAFIIFAQILLILAAPPLLARFALLSGDGTREALLEGRTVTDNELNRFMHSREQALHWRRTNEIFGDLALGAFTQAKRMPPQKPATNDEWKQALQWQERALAQSPADTYGWAREAYLSLKTEGPSAKAADAVAHSIETAPYEPRLMISRVSMAMLLQDRLDAETRDAMPQQMEMAWRYNPQWLVNAAEDGHYRLVVESALRDQPEELAAFKGLVAYK